MTVNDAQSQVAAMNITSYPREKGEIKEQLLFNLYDTVQDMDVAFTPPHDLVNLMVWTLELAAVEGLSMDSLLAEYFESVK